MRQATWHPDEVFRINITLKYQLTPDEIPGSIKLLGCRNKWRQVIRL